MQGFLRVRSQKRRNTCISKSSLADAFVVVGTEQTHICTRQVCVFVRRQTLCKVYIQFDSKFNRINHSGGRRTKTRRNFALTYIII